MDEIHAIAEDASLAVIEDAAYASVRDIQRQTSRRAFSFYGLFLFQAIKHLTTGDGGALCCLDAKDEAKRAAGDGSASIGIGICRLR